MVVHKLDGTVLLDVHAQRLQFLDEFGTLSAAEKVLARIGHERRGEIGVDVIQRRAHIGPLVILEVGFLHICEIPEDFVRKPDSAEGRDAFFRSLHQKIVVASCAKVVPHHRPEPHTAAATPAAPARSAAPTAPLAAPAILGRSTGLDLDRTIIGLGASTGGTEATLEVLKRLPADIPGMVIVQHMPPGFTEMYAQRLNKLCAMEVREAKNGDEIHRGLALIAPADLQARVVRMGTRYTLSCQPGEKVSGHRPSVDALFSSMAAQVKCHMVGIIMTGMGRDGASGLLEMRKAGAYTIGQDKESCVVYGMPCVAHEIGAVAVQASCYNIASVLMQHLKNER